MITEITIRNFLSFGPETPAFAMKPLNVLIGPNGCGKSNFIEALGYLNLLARQDNLPILDLLWKGGKQNSAHLEVVVSQPSPRSDLRYWAELREEAQRCVVTDERLEFPRPVDEFHPKPYVFFRRDLKGAKINYRAEKSDTGWGSERILRGEEIDLSRSVLRQRRDQVFYPELTHVGKQLSSIALYRATSFGPLAVTRRPQPADLPNDVLLEDGSNLALILNDLLNDPKLDDRLRELLSDFYDPAKGLNVKVQGGTAQVFVKESGWATPATRLSDGTMRWLYLLAILLHPSPPPLVAIDEPDLGLHPDMIRTLADLLVDLSGRTQVVITTHSEVLIDALGSDPSRVVVCEKADGSTTLTRLDADALKAWLEKYSLGYLWRTGKIGGNRW